MKRIVKGALVGLALITAAGCAGGLPKIMYEKQGVPVEEKKYDLSACREEAFAKFSLVDLLSAGLPGDGSFWKFDKEVESCLKGRGYTKSRTN